MRLRSVMSSTTDRTHSSPSIVTRSAEIEAVEFRAVLTRQAGLEIAHAVGAGTDSPRNRLRACGSTHMSSSRHRPIQNIGIGVAEGCGREGFVDREVPEVVQPDQHGRYRRQAEGLREALLAGLEGAFRLPTQFQVGEGEQHAGVVAHVDGLAGHDHEAGVAAGERDASFHLREWSVPRSDARSPAPGPPLPRRGRSRRSCGPGRAPARSRVMSRKPWLTFTKRRSDRRQMMAGAGLAAKVFSKRSSAAKRSVASVRSRTRQSGFPFGVGQDEAADAVDPSGVFGVRAGVTSTVMSSRTSPAITRSMGY